MKTTENISLGGLAFVIESDAYTALNQYIEDIRKSFRNDSYGNEIVEDIEIRISELLKERCIVGMVVNLSMVEEIRRIIGEPEVLGEQEAEAQQTEDSHTKTVKCSLRERRLYRDIDNKVISGVCAGLGEYFNLDKVIFRILFLVFFVLGLIDVEEGMFTISAIAYILLWIAVPAARTVEEKCEMRRKPVNLEGFRSKENRFEREIRETVNSPAGRKLSRILLTVIGIFLLTSGIGGLLSMIFIPGIQEIAEAAMITELSPFDAEEMLAVNMIRNSTFWWMSTASIGIACIGMIYGGILLIFDFKNPSWKPGLILFITWIISLLVFAAWVITQVIDWIPTII